MSDSKVFKLTIAKVDGPLFDGDAKSVNVPGVGGQMTVLKDHEPFISPLKAGIIEVVNGDGEIESFDVNDGTIEISDNQVAVLLT